MEETLPYSFYMYQPDTKSKHEQRKEGREGGREGGRQKPKHSTKRL
jgi:hypothetical protein